MKYVWEAVDVVAGRRVKHLKGGDQMMIFADNQIGNDKRFGLVNLADGIVSARGHNQKLVAELLTENLFEPLSLNPFAHQKPDEEDV